MSYNDDLKRTAWNALQPTKPEFSQEELEHFGNFCTLSGIAPEGLGGSPFSLEGRNYTLPLYDQTRSTLKRRTVKRKAAQLGLTIEMLYKGAWLTADVKKRCNYGFYFPTQDEVYDLHKSRFRPMMNSSPRMKRLIEQGGVDSVEVVRIGYSNMRFRGLRTGSAVDSVPLDAIAFDEVRLMALNMVLRAFLRVSESKYFEDGKPGIIDLNSTAGFPDTDIDYFFSRSTQNYWHVYCSNHQCVNHSKGMVLEEQWEKYVDFAKKHYICAACGTPITDEQIGLGGYVPLGPSGAEYEGYTFSKVMKGNLYLPTMINAFEEMVVDGHNPAEFHNSFLARPFRDPNAVIVTEEVFDRARQLETSYLWPDASNKEGWLTAIGIDQRPEEKHVVVLRVSPNKRFYVTHLEIIQSTATMDERAVIGATIALIRYWKADVVVIDRMPDSTYSGAVGRAFPDEVVWLAEYQDQGTQDIRWSDEDDLETVRKTAQEFKFAFIVKLVRYNHLLQAFNLWKNNRVILPHNAFEQKFVELRRDGVKQPVPLAAEFRDHLKNIAKISVPVYKTHPLTKEQLHTGKYKYIFRNIALDPHFAHAYGYAIAAASRRIGTTMLTMLGSEPQKKAEGEVELLLEGTKVTELKKKTTKTCAECRFFTSPPEGKTLGSCSNALVAKQWNAEPPVQTKADYTNCRHFSRQK